MNNNEENQNTKKISKRDQIYSYLWNSILTNKIKAKERIYEKDIMALFNISLTPVREAILKLEEKGAVEINQYRHPIVKEISFEEFWEIGELYRVLEDHALKQVFFDLTDEDAQKLEEIVREIEPVSNIEHFDEFNEKSNQFHAYLRSKFKNAREVEILKQLLDELNIAYQHHGYLLWSKNKRYFITQLKGYKSTVEAIKNKDKALLNSVLRSYKRTIDKFQKSIEKNK